MKTLIIQFLNRTVEKIQLFFVMHHSEKLLTEYFNLKFLINFESKTLGKNLISLNEWCRILFLFMALVSDGFGDFLHTLLKGFAGVLNSYTEFLQTIIVPSQ